MSLLFPKGVQFIFVGAVEDRLRGILFSSLSNVFVVFFSC